MILSLEAYEDAVWDALKRRGFTTAQLFNTPSGFFDVLPHCHMKGRDVEAVADSLAEQLKTQGV